jgi:hypothetical protein
MGNYIWRKTAMAVMSHKNVNLNLVLLIMKIRNDIILKLKVGTTDR